MQDSEEIDKSQAEIGERRSTLERDALRSVLNTRQGRRLIWALLGKCGFARNPFAADNNVTNFNCGRQSVATDLLVEIDQINPDAFHLMSKESKEDNDYVNRNTSGNNAASDGNPDSINAINTGKF